MSSNTRHSAVLQDLRTRLRQIDRSGAQPLGAGAPYSTGVAGLDALLPVDTFRAGMIIEWIVEGAGVGAARLALPMAMQALQTGGSLVVIDDRREFYPPAAVPLGLDLERTIVVRPCNLQETMWALEQSLRCAGVAATLGWIDKIPDRVFRRLQLAAEHGAGLGLLVRPIAARHEPTWADLRWLVQSLPGSGGFSPGRNAASPMQVESVWPGLDDAGRATGRRLRVELLHCRGGAGGRVVTLEISDETGAVLVVSPVGAPANLPRATGA